MQKLLEKQKHVVYLMSQTGTWKGRSLIQHSQILGFLTL